MIKDELAQVLVISPLFLSEEDWLCQQSDLATATCAKQR